MRRGLVVKRLFDIVASLLLIIVSTPLMIWAAAQIRRDSPGGVLFRQTRIGQGGRPFLILKLRTMRVRADSEWKPPNPEDFDAFVFQDPDDPRITRIGGYLRRTSMDELPQLLNVLKGDMSLVGPRPEIPEMVALYRPGMHRRHNLKPGITGLAQISGRGSLTTGEIMAHDLVYCDTWSLSLDCWILKETVRQVLRRQNVR